MHAQMMMQTHPEVEGDVEDDADHLKLCIRLDMDCADLCAAAGKVATRRTGSNLTTLRIALAACVEACRVCANECERHGDMHEHCAICADACRICEDLCRGALGQAPISMQ